MRMQRKKAGWLAALLVLAGCGVVVFLFLDSGKTARAEEEARQAVEQGGDVDFAKLQKANPDIFGWLYVPGVGISCPLLRREGDDVYYLTHGSDGKESPDGAVHIQPTYNHNDMEDPVTVLFGSAPESGEIFGKLQEAYSGGGGVEAYGAITVYLPGRKLDYAVFAAAPASKAHILYNYDCSDPDMYQLLLDRVMAIRAIGASFNKEIPVTTDDKIVILNTELKGSTDKRYLVLAKRL